MNGYALLAQMAGFALGAAIAVTVIHIRNVIVFERWRWWR